MIWRTLVLILVVAVAGCGLHDVGADDDAAVAGDDDDTTATGDDDTTPTDDDDTTPTDDDDTTPADDDDDTTAADDDSASDDDDTTPTGPDCVTDFWSCNHPSQCVEVFADCCGCANGGTSFAINAACTAQWETFVEATFGPCAGMGCLAVYLCDGSVPRCEGGACTYRP